MTKRELGHAVKFLRMKKQAEVKELCRGICSEAIIFRLEEGKRVPDYMTLGTIISRLGKSINKVEVLFSQNEYELYRIQNSIEKALDEGLYETAGELIQGYEKREEAGQPLHYQCILKNKAILSIESGNIREGLAFLEKAISISLPEIDRNHIQERLMGEEELVLLIMWVEQKNKAGQFVPKEFCEQMLEYIEEYYTDEEIVVSVYPKAAWVYLRQLEDTGETERGIQLCEKTIHLLTLNGMLLYLPQFLERYIGLLSAAGNEEEAKKMGKQAEALKWVFQTYGRIYPTEAIRVWKSYSQKEIYLMQEIIKQERRRNKQSQEALAGMINLDQKTISRIETGRHTPKPGTFQKLKEQLEIQRDIYSTELIVENFELLEIKRNIGRALSLREYEKAKALFEELGSKVTLKAKENLQYMQYMGAVIDRRLLKITVDEAIEECRKALQLTRNGCRAEDVSALVLGKQEAEIVNYIAVRYYEKNEKLFAIQILENVLKGYAGSEVNFKNHYVGVTLIYDSLSRYYEETDQFDKAIQCCKEGIELQVDCNRCNLLVQILTQMAYTTERVSTNQETSQIHYKQAYQLALLVNDEYYQKLIANHCASRYQKDISRCL